MGDVSFKAITKHAYMAIDLLKESIAILVYSASGFSAKQQANTA